MSEPLKKPGVRVLDRGVEFSVYSENATGMELCLFDKAGAQTAKLPMAHAGGNLFRLMVDGIKPGQRYGYRAFGEWDPMNGLWFDPAKLLTDPYAREIDRPYRYDPDLSEFGVDTADMVPKSIVVADSAEDIGHVDFPDGGLIYEAGVRALTMLHPDVPKPIRGTVAALAHPAVIDHLKKLGVDAIELLPVTAWMDERHLQPLGLTNAWGYNPVTFMALEPRICPGGIAELRGAVKALHEAGIGVILDLVFNHSGESDQFGGVVSFRGLDNATYYRLAHDDPSVLINDTGCGNTIACDHPMVRCYIVDSLRHFVTEAGIDGFRFDLAPVLGRRYEGFDPDSETLHAILNDPVLKDRTMIAEPWDIGPGGYHLGNFPPPFLEWNDVTRDDIRKFWRGDPSMTGQLADALSGSSHIFSTNGQGSTRSVNFIAAHDGFSLYDLTAYVHKHNAENGEHNRDGHDENYSWNNGVEGETDNELVNNRRRQDLRALLATLFVSRGAIMLKAGDEGGCSQKGNNNAYCQDNEITWLDWAHMDGELVAHTAELSALRKRFAVFSQTDFFTDDDVLWLRPDGKVMDVADWECPECQCLSMVLATTETTTGHPTRLAVLINRGLEEAVFLLPEAHEDGWHSLAGQSQGAVEIALAPRSVSLYAERLNEGETH
ncbi:glycogen debranching protein GlgX [Martelella mediterranea]|uniref:Glycogen debranching enzyme n=1 Tax=Martelella mediterranea DSM 17316 TaxID=1122214 RepID=A0A1U9Z608_9HYPH|nr:glycogen debranching protein GlgX [Martelella mediterranea]AQZ53147.1 Glycogen debranching enzyme [Martelella mediterranea DSM 17316]